MLKAASIWFLCVLLSTFVVLWGLKLAGKDIRWIGRHLFLFIIMIFSVALATEFAGTKPPPGPDIPDVPTVKGITLGRVSTDPNKADLQWTRDDGLSSSNKAYAVRARRKGTSKWSTMQIIDADTKATIPGFWIRDDYEWRVDELEVQDAE